MIQQAASPLEVYNRPANAFVAGFIGSPAMNFLELSLAEAKLVDPDNGLAIAIPDRLRGALAGHGKPKVLLGLRPEALCVPSHGTTPRTTLRALSSMWSSISGMKRCSTLRAARIGLSPG